MSRIHGIPIHCTDPAPLATRDGIVGYYDGWDLQTERASVAGKKCMKQDQNWYEKYGWKTEPGYYEVLFGLAKSISPNWDQKMVCLNGLQKEDPAWQVCPIVVGAPILLAHLSETGEDLLDGDICLFAEMLRDSDRAGLSVVHGYVVAGCRWVGYRFKDFSFAVCRKL